MSLSILQFSNELVNSKVPACNWTVQRASGSPWKHIVTSSDCSFIRHLVHFDSLQRK